MSASERNDARKHCHPNVSEGAEATESANRTFEENKKAFEATCNLTHATKQAACDKKQDDVIEQAKAGKTITGTGGPLEKLNKCISAGLTHLKDCFDVTKSWTKPSPPPPGSFVSSTTIGAQTA